MCLQEEIAHCAAGVKWLTYLYQQANAQPLGQEAEVSTVKPQMQTGNCAASARNGSACEEPGSIGAMSSQLQSHSIQHAQPHAAESADGVQNASYEWQKDARQHSTVEEWFHALVRAHFKGSLKVGCHSVTEC